MNNTSDFDAQVDIIIPFHGQYEKVTDLVESIYRCTRSNYFTVTLVDDHSPNESFINHIAHNLNRSISRTKSPNKFNAVRGKEQRGFAACLEIGFERTESPFVCFMNSDCMVEDPNWLKSMGETLLKLKGESVRMVAPITNEPVEGDPAQKGDRTDRTLDHVIIEDDSHLSWVCVLCHRELFARCGGFLKPYPYGYYEDEEFAGRMRKYGFKQAVAKSSWVYHEGRATVKSLWRKDPAIRKIMEEENRERCIADLKSI
jgi:GT2 family glycosyltransferase